MAIPECLSVTWYESISGEELKPYRSFNSHVVRSFVGGYEPFRAIIYRSVPIYSIGIEYWPRYYDTILKDKYGSLYQSPGEAFRSIDETKDFPEMALLLQNLFKYQGEGLPAKLYYDGKAAEALSLVFEYHMRLNSRTATVIPEADKAEHLLAYTYLPIGEIANAVGYSAAGHFADIFRKIKGVLPMEYRRLSNVPFGNSLVLNGRNSSYNIENSTKIM